jgi:hypothetical protein
LLACAVDVSTYILGILRVIYSYEEFVLYKLRRELQMLKKNLREEGRNKLLLFICNTVALKMCSIKSCMYVDNIQVFWV